MTCFLYSTVLFGLTGIGAAVFPLVLFVTKVFDGAVLENWIFYLLAVIVSGVTLAHSYASLATKTRKGLLAVR